MKDKQTDYNNINAQDYNGDTALINACKKGDLEKIKDLLEQEGIDVNIQGQYGYTPLMRAVHNSHENIVALLLEKEETKLNLKNEDGCTALMFAVDNSDQGIAIRLIEDNRVEVNLQDEDGYTALMAVSEDGSWDNLDILKCLLEKKGINVNLQDEDGYTALMLAVDNGYEDIAMRLLKKEEIDVNVQNNDGFTALDLCEKTTLTGKQCINLLHAKMIFDSVAKDQDNEQLLMNVDYTAVKDLLIENFYTYLNNAKDISDLTIKSSSLRGNLKNSGKLKEGNNALKEVFDFMAKELDSISCLKLKVLDVVLNNGYEENFNLTNIISDIVGFYKDHKIELLANMYKTVHANLKLFDDINITNKLQDNNNLCNEDDLTTIGDLQDNNNLSNNNDFDF